MMTTKRATTEFRATFEALCGFLMLARRLISQEKYIKAVARQLVSQGRYIKRTARRLINQGRYIKAVARQLVSQGRYIKAVARWLVSETDSVVFTLYRMRQHTEYVLND